MIPVLLRFSQNNNKRVVNKLMVKTYSFKQVQRKVKSFFNVHDYLQCVYGYKRMTEVLLHTFI